MACFSLQSCVSPRSVTKEEPESAPIVPFMDSFDLFGNELFTFSSLSLKLPRLLEDKGF